MLQRLYIDKSQALTPAILRKIIQKFNTTNRADILFTRGYYDGVNQRIMKKKNEDPTKPCNRIVRNFCLTITQNFQGYLVGKGITYSAASDNDITALLDCLNANDIENSDSVWLKNALVSGAAYQLCYVNENGDKCFRNLDSSSCFPIYSADLDEKLLYFVSYTPVIDWTSEDWATSYQVSVYDDKYIYTYTCDSSFNNLIPAAEPQEHYFGEVPVAVFELNDDRRSVFEPIISLQDAYNELLSDEVDDFSAFVDAYLVLTNVTADEEDLAAMKQSRTLLLDQDATASYLTKSISDTQVENMLTNLRASIHTVSNSPDFSSEEFNQGVSSGIALQYKLLGFMNVAANIEANFRKALNQRIHLLNSIYGLVDSQAFEVNITFNYNLPTDIANIVNTINSLRGLVSDRTLLAQIPFVKDVDAELEATDIYGGEDLWNKDTGQSE